MSMICLSIYHKKYKKAEYLINNGHDLNEKLCSLSALMWAISRSNYIAILLIKKGCDINLQDFGGFTPLMYSSIYKKKNIMLKILLRKPNVCIITSYKSFFDISIRNNQYYGLKYYYFLELKS